MMDRAKGSTTETARTTGWRARFARFVSDMATSYQPARVGTHDLRHKSNVFVAAFVESREMESELDAEAAAELRVAATRALARCCDQCRLVLRDQLQEEEFSPPS